jgi:hypothetical protein
MNNVDEQRQMGYCNPDAIRFSDDLNVQVRDFKGNKVKF